MLSFAKETILHLKKYLLSIAELPSKLEWDIRRSIYNSRSGVYISPKAFVARTVKLRLNHGKHFLGGKIYISDNALVTDGVILSPYGGSIYVGENVFIGPYCVINGHGGLTIGKDSMIAAHSVIIPSNHEFSNRNMLISQQAPIDLGITIGEDVWVGCGVRILDSVLVGKGCVIGAGAVVNKSISDYSIAVGVPAKVIGERGQKVNSSLNRIEDKTVEK